MHHLDLHTRSSKRSSKPLKTNTHLARVSGAEVPKVQIVQKKASHPTIFGHSKMPHIGANTAALSAYAARAATKEEKGIRGDGTLPLRVIVVGIADTPSSLAYAPSSLTLSLRSFGALLRHFVSCPAKCPPDASSGAPARRTASHKPACSVLTKCKCQLRILHH